LGAQGFSSYMCGPINRKGVRKCILEYFQVEHARNIVVECHVSTTLITPDDKKVGGGAF
jgi:hypothetical protein